MSKQQRSLERVVTGLPNMPGCIVTVDIEKALILGDEKSSGLTVTERNARHQAKRLGYRLHRTRKRKGPGNAGEFVLVNQLDRRVVLGWGFAAPIEVISAFLEQKRQALVAAGAGLPQSSDNTVRLVKRRAKRFGYSVHKSRRSISYANEGKLLLINATGTVMQGARFTASAERILDFLKQRAAFDEEAR